MAIYPKPSPAGGRLIRQVISNLRKSGVKLPTDSHILIAVSGGPDSVALAHLLVRYGRRVGEKVELLHVNHHTRGEESENDMKHVQKLAEIWEVKLHVANVYASRCPKGESLEAYLSQERHRIYEEFTDGKSKRKCLIFTAHTADDLAETLLWRLFTGAHETMGGGIYLKKGKILRPLLNIRKAELLEYLRSEKLTYREDKTNRDIRFTRAYVRHELIPRIEERFPRAIEGIVRAGIRAQRVRFRNLT